MRISVKYYRSLLVWLSGFLIGGAIMAQTPTCKAPGSPVDPDNWRRVAVHAHEHSDTVSPELRKQRDEYWTKLTIRPMNSDAPAYMDTDSIVGSSPGGPGSAAAFNPNMFWVVGTFINYDVYQSQAGTIYTEIHFMVDRILGTHAKQSMPTIGSIVDVGMLGGCLITQSGATKDFGTFYKGKMRPGHRYLVVLTRSSNGAFFDQANVLADLTSGVAQPVSEQAVDAVKRGQWKFTGLTEEATLQLVEETSAKNN